MTTETLIMWKALPFLLATVLFAAFPSRGSADDKPRLNVVILLADDLGAGDLGCCGHPKFKTPNIDKLAADGARLTNFYSPTPYCAPSRASLMTGRYPFRCGLLGNPVPLGDSPDRTTDKLGLPVTEKTLADMFHAAGYKTGCFGKWHLGHQPEYRPLKRGFDEYYGLLYSNDMHPVELIDGDKRVEYPVVQTTLTPRLADRAIAFVEANKEKPFFLYVPFTAPHKPLAPAEAFYNKSGAGLYGDVIADLDANVGRILTRLKELGLEKNTLVIFASDNGPWYGGSTGGLRGMKGQNWEGGIRVPLIVRWPGKIPAGHKSDEPAIMMDLFTTTLKAADVAPPKDVFLDGKDIMPLLTGEAKSPHEALFSMRGDQLYTIRSGKWKLHLAVPGPAKPKVWKPDEKYEDPRRPDGVRILAPYEQAHPSQFPGVQTGDAFEGATLFDLEKDPQEQHNVAKDNPKVVEELKAAFEKAKKDFPKKP
jgi:uncharacterized sulfatase